LYLSDSGFPALVLSPERSAAVSIAPFGLMPPESATNAERECFDAFGRSPVRFGRLRRVSRFISSGVRVSGSVICFSISGAVLASNSVSPSIGLSRTLPFVVSSVFAPVVFCFSVRVSGAEID
jgi:hypothetical protein